MKKKLFISLVSVCGLFIDASAAHATGNVLGGEHKKGTYFFYWGWNRDNYSKSDIHFQGDGYDFTLHDAKADDKQSTPGFDPYLNPSRITIPQTNVKIGYFFADHYNVSFGLDHMKYVMRQKQTVKMSGTISNSGTSYDGTYDNQNVDLSSRELLTFEHTDGLNYVHAEVERFDTVLNLRRYNIADIDISLLEGVGAGFLYPKTNARIFGKPRHDDFHVSGYGTNVKIGANIAFLTHYFVQAELKAGYINMSDIRTTKSSDDRADQHFFFDEMLLLVGCAF